MMSLDVVQLPAVMALTSGQHRVVVGLLDGPVVLSHPELATERIQGICGAQAGGCADARSLPCRHGTFVAGILSARRGSSAPAICPGCTLLLRPIFSEPMAEGERLPSTTPRQLAAGICECVDAGAWVLNVSAAMAQPSSREEPDLRDALDYAAARGVIVVAAAGNEGTLGSSAITRHPWVIPVVGYDPNRQVTAQTNLGNSAGRRGLGAPGQDVTSLSPPGGSCTRTGTSFAAAFVTGAIALLWSLYPRATPVEIKSAVTNSHRQRRTSVVPPLLDAWGAYSSLARTQPRKAPA
jgi:subtilisin family serine protease